MIVLDTNTVSEIIKRRRPDARVLRWFDSQPLDDLCIASMTAAELLYGMVTLPEGRRKNELREDLCLVIDHFFEGRVLPLDDVAARRLAHLRSDCRRRGRTIPIADAVIAATALANGAQLATRNIGDFTASGVELIDPWCDD